MKIDKLKRIPLHLCLPLKALASWGVFALMVTITSHATGQAISTNTDSQKKAAIPHKTWAVLSTSDTESSKVAELLSAELSGDENYTVVSRDELQKIAGEKFLQKLFALKNFKERADILNIIKTDMLIVVTPGRYNRKKVIRCIVLDRQSALCLMSEQVSTDNIDKAITVLIEKIKKCRRKYLNGIQYVVGITPFLSDNLTHKFDYLSDAYRELLTEMFLAHDGVAVCEIAEIKTLAEESEFDGQKLNRDMVSVIITGKYTVKNSGNILFDIQITTKNNKPIKQKKAVHASGVTDFFNNIITQILRDPENKKISFSKEDQLKFLMRKADEEESLGLDEDAARLREAALLIDPENVKLRLTLLDDYYNFYEILFKHPYGKDISRNEKERIRKLWHSKISAANERAFQHIAWLIANRKITKKQAANLLDHHFIRISSEIPPEEQTRLRDRQFERDKFIFPLFQRLPTEQKSTPCDSFSFYSGAYRFYPRTINLLISPEKDFPRAIYFFNNMVPDTPAIWESFVRFFIRIEIVKGDWDTITAEQWQDFLHKLSKSPKKPVRELSEIALINCKLWHVKKLSEVEKSLLLKKLLFYVDEWKKFVSGHKGGFPTTETALHASIMYDYLKGMYRRLTGKEYEPHKRWKPKPKPNDWRMDPSSWHKHGTPTMLGKLRFSLIQPKSLNLNQLEEFQPFRFATGYGKKDIIWNDSNIWELTSKLEFRPIIKRFDPRIRDVQKGKKLIWVMHECSLNRFRDAISVYDYSGKLVASITSDKIPDTPGSLYMQIAHNNTLFLVGHISPNDRVWIAKLTLHGKTIKVNLFFQAKRQGTAFSPADYSKDTHFVFIPQYVHLVKMKNRDNDFILIGRETRQNAVSWQAAPLAVNLKTLEVGILKTLYNGQVFKKRNYLVSSNSVILSQDGLDNVDIPENWQSWQAFNRRKIIRPPYIRAYDFSIPFSDGTGFSDGHFFYLFARKAFRIDMVSGKAENLTIGNLPNEYHTSITDGIYSNTHGILLIVGRKLYKVKISDDICWYPEEAKKK